VGHDGRCIPETRPSFSRALENLLSETDEPKEEKKSRFTGKEEGIVLIVAKQFLQRAKHIFQGEV
jgi:hypothetical protein